MIARDKVLQVGRFNKPHGVKGELSATFDYDICGHDARPEHIFVMLDGLLVPFSLSAIRRKSAETVLLTLKGIGGEAEASVLGGAPIFIEKELLPQYEDEGDDVVYLEDLVGYTVYDGDNKLGTVTGYDDSTDNVLFTIEDCTGTEMLVPAADDLIDEIDEENTIVRMSLPQGLTDL